MRILISVLFCSPALSERAPHPGATGVAFVQSATNLARSLQLAEEEEIPDLEHMHLVCHRHGCKEVQATLDVIKAAKVEAQAGLDQCAKDRAALSDKLGEVSKQRAMVEADLAKCAAERSDLEGKLAKCGKHRAEVEADLKKCAIERAALERELKQCAEVDRPAAEKALAECGKDRAALEKKLKELEENLKNGSADSSRRRSARRRASLIETNDTVVESEEAAEEAALLAQISLTKHKLFEQKVKENDLTEQLQNFANKLTVAVRSMDEVDKRSNGIVGRMNDNDNNIARIRGEVQGIEQRQAALLNQTGVLNSDISETATAAQGLAEKETTAAEQVSLASIQLAKAQIQLLSLMMDDQNEEEERLNKKHQHTAEKLAQSRVLLAGKEEAEEECEDLRVEVITTAASVKAIEKKLAACLATKKELNEKIAAAEEATNAAREGLQKCTTTKASLTAALTECGEKCAETETLLNECLERKKVLKVKIDECHAARDLAREKLQECLDKKDELGEKIADLQSKIDAMGLLQGKSSSHDELSLSSAVHSVLSIMKSISTAEQEAMRASVALTGAETGIEIFDAGTADALTSASGAMDDTQETMHTANKELGVLRERIETVGHLLQVSGVNTGLAQKRAAEVAGIAER